MASDSSTMLGFHWKDPIPREETNHLSILLVRDQGQTKVTGGACELTGPTVHMGGVTSRNTGDPKAASLDAGFPIATEMETLSV